MFPALVNLTVSIIWDVVIVRSLKLCVMITSYRPLHVHTCFDDLD